MQPRAWFLCSLSLLLVAFWTHSSLAQPAANDPLAEGRRLEAAGDYPGAVNAFDSALKGVPNNASTLSELGWALYKAKNYKRAEDVTLQSIMAATGDAKLKAAGYYNLGRIYDDTNQKEPALEAYRASVKARPSKAAQERIDALSGTPSSGGPTTSFAVAKIAGPFASLKAACSGVTANKEIESCDWKPIATAAKLPAPFAEAKTGEIVAAGDVSYKLALRSGDSWFVTEIFGTSADTSGRFGTHTRLDSVALAAVPSSARASLTALAKVVSETGTDSGPLVEQRQLMLVCGVGPSHKPSCSAPMLASVRIGHKPEQKLAIDVRADAVTVTKQSQTLDDHQKSLVGRVQLQFE